MQALVTDNRALAPALHWLTVACPELDSIQPGQFVMARCAPEGSADPFLRRKLWPVRGAAQRAPGGATALLVEIEDPASEWLARSQPGAVLDLLGPLGRPLGQLGQPQALLLLAEGPGVGALLTLAAQASARGAAAVLLQAAPEALRLPPYLLPPDIEYLAASGDALALLDTAAGGGRLDTPLLWADQLVAAGPPALASRLAARIRRDRFNWKPGFGRFIVQQPFACGLGLCGGCWHDTRRGARLLCQSGPGLDLRDAV